MSGRSVPRDAPEGTTEYGERTTGDEGTSTSHEERTANDEGTPRPRLLDAITLVSLGYIIRDRFGPVGEKIGSWTDGPPERVRNVIREQTEEITREAVDQFLNSSQRVAEQADGTTGGATDRIEETSEELGDRIQEGGERVGETIKEGGEEAGEKLQQGGEEASEALEEGGEGAGEELEADGDANKTVKEGSESADEKSNRRWDGRERESSGRRDRNR